MTKKSKEKSKTCTAPPLETPNKEEYADLLQTASSLTPQEAQVELVECARYGEFDAVRALLQVWSDKIEDFVNTTDDYGSTALHKASASGHESTVQLLLYHKAKHLPNTTGKNTPLHWAAANGHEKIVELILNHDFDSYQINAIDVLLKNSGGRSALTEGFTSQNTKLVGMLLEHDSAAEERLLMGAGGGARGGGARGGGASSSVCAVHSDDCKNGEIDHNNDEIDRDDNTPLAVQQGVVHEFNFLRDNSNHSTEQNDENISTEEVQSQTQEQEQEQEQEEEKTLLVRELPIENADCPFDDGHDKLDTTGLGIWSASIVMARWMADKSILGRFDGKNVLELGAGCGVPGLVVGLYSTAKHVYVTDYNPVTMDNLQYNIDMNANRPYTKSPKGSGEGEWVERVKAISIDWNDETTWPQEKMDYVIGSDLIYQKSIVPLLWKVVKGLIKDDGIFLYTCPSDGRDGLQEFIDSVKNEGFYCYSQEVAPDLYRSNPLSNGDADQAFLHFYELPVTEYKLYEFRKRKTNN
eukprot:CAMPEP_0176489304 /NCGR_PEP_ID=MMETSP0200_2-20121128/7209_1 /TAXON_ID=947934 /ORGANISM="Chaetoceros sp., Strain GSL56" /LENGTH=524 /DNA_ID=CAMNT_0017886421 /DNA_START=63 /DNA_END=1637 /DNA_ORIENTATION=+